MKKSNKQVNQKQKQSILNASRMLRKAKPTFTGSDEVSVENYPTKIGLLGKVKKSETFLEIKGFRVPTGAKADSIKMISPEFLEEVSTFLEKEPNNIYAQRITKTLVKGVSFE